MQLCKVRLPNGEIRIAVLDGEQLFPLPVGRDEPQSLSDLLHAADTEPRVRTLLGGTVPIPATDATFLPPVDRQEIWAAGVTYKRSKDERERESAGAAQFYDRVYTAPRPELFFKCAPGRAVGTGTPVRIRRDARWNVPEPELALIVSPTLQIVGFTIGNDMSSRDIEGENPLYLPQAKVYDRSCALGPVVTLAAAMPAPDQTVIELSIRRAGAVVFNGATRVSQMARSFEDLVAWLGRENEFPDGLVLLTGTGVVPPDDFTLAVGDVVSIGITGIGTLTNSVEQRV
jgi:2-dehydro-3-deoxy-D-arabinonate dehydratase